MTTDSEICAELADREVCSEACGAEGSNFEVIFVHALRQLFNILTARLQSMNFWSRQLRAVSGKREDHTCSICLDENCALETLGILPCAHIFHLDCIDDVGQ